MRVRPGDILYVNRGRLVGRVAVLTSSRRKGGMKLQVLTPSGISVQLTARDFSDVPRVLGRIELPTPYAPNRAQFQRQVARLLSRATVAGATHRQSRPLEHGDDGGIDHPVAEDPDAAGAAARRRPGRARGARGRRPAPAHPGPQPVRLPPLRPGAAHPRGVGVRRRLGADRRRSSPGRVLPRVRPARRGGRAPGPPRRARSGRAGRPGVGLQLRAPQPRRAAGAVVPVARRPQAVGGHRVARRRAALRRGGGRPPGDAGAGPDVRRAGPRLGGRAVVRVGGRGRGPVGRRLRPHHEAAHRPAAPAGPAGPGRRDAGAAAREAADRLFRGVVAASTAIDVDDEGSDDGNDREGPPRS